MFSQFSALSQESDYPRTQPSTKLRRDIIKAFKLCGLQLETNAIKLLEQALAPEDNVRECIKAVLANIEKENMKSCVVTEASIRTIVMQIGGNSSIGSIDLELQVISAYDTPKLVYNEDRKTFYPSQEQRTLYGGPPSKAQMYRERFQILRQRTLRNPLFTAPVLASNNDGYMTLTPIESLLGSSGVRCVIGMLTHMQSGQYYVEDLSASVPVDLTQVQEERQTQGMITEGCIVLLEGQFVDDCFRVEYLGFPPQESRADTLAAHPGVDFFGGAPTAQEKVQLQRLEQDSNAMFVVLSDVWLDDAKVLRKLETLFEGFSESPPTAFILMGNFISVPFDSSDVDVSSVEQAFGNLADMLARFPVLCNDTDFVFIPGPADPGLADVLPRPPLPTRFTQRLRNRLKRGTFATNPCRIRHGAHEMVFFREDLLSKMRRHCIITPNDTDETAAHEHLTLTICDQAHLCPLPLEVRPIYWAHSSAMQLYPLPDTLCIADSFDEWEVDYFQTTAFNPGSFPADSSFVAYCPYQEEGRVEYSRIDDTAAPME